MSEKNDRVKRKYGFWHELRQFDQLRSRARQQVIRNVLGTLGIVTLTVILALAYKTIAFRYGF